MANEFQNEGTYVDEPGTYETDESYSDYDEDNYDEFDYDDEDNDEEETESAETQESKGWDPDLSPLPNTVNERAELIVRETLNESNYSPEHLQLLKHHDKSLENAEAARRRGDEENAKFWEVEAQLATRGLPEKSRFTQEVESRAARKYEEEVIEEFTWRDADDFALMSPQAQKDVENLLDAWNARNAENEGHFYVLYDGKDIWNDKIDGFSGDDIKKVEVKPENWKQFLARFGGVLSQKNLRRHFGALHMLPRELTEQEEKEQRQRKASERKQKEKDKWYEGRKAAREEKQKDSLRNWIRL